MNADFIIRFFPFLVSIFIFCFSFTLLTLAFLDPPQIRSSDYPEEVSVVVNNVLELVCEATGIPRPTVTWLKDERPLPQIENALLLRGGEILRISSAQVGLPRFKM